MIGVIKMGMRILVIEDNIFTLDEIEARLNELGYDQIETAVSADEAIAKAKTFTPDLLLSDINLGSGKSGIEAVQKIKERMNIPVIYLTAYAEDDHLKKVERTEPFAYLVKPLQKRDLHIAIQIARFKHASEQKLIDANTKLAKAMEEKDKLFSILAHDLIQPFNALLGLTQILLEDFDSLELKEQKEMIARVHEVSKGTYHLIENLLAWSRSQTDKIIFRAHKVDPVAIIDDVLALYKNVAQKKNICFQVTLNKGDIFLSADENMLSVIIRNLVNNAIKFTPAGGRISISGVVSTQHSGFAEISIADSGVGIAPEKMEHLFQVGNVLSTQGTEGEKGSGLGLVLCREFVQRHGGNLDIQSQPGQGSVFTLILPLWLSEGH